MIARTLLISLILLVSSIGVAGGFASAQTSQAACEGAGGTWVANQCRIGGANPEGAIERVIGTALNLISIVVGIAAVIMIMLAGFRYITASGDSGKISSAQNTIIWAIVGLVVVAFSQVIVRFVLNRL